MIWLRLPELSTREMPSLDLKPGFLYFGCCVPAVVPFHLSGYALQFPISVFPLQAGPAIASFQLSKGKACA